MGGRTSQRTNTVSTNWGGLVIQATVNWREGLDNRMSSGSVISFINYGFCKSQSKVNMFGWQLAAKWTYALDYVSIFFCTSTSVHITCREK